MPSNDNQRLIIEIDQNSQLSIKIFTFIDNSITE